jgi:phosphatidylserine/phosphatidylglycerophosphate/cardiolipin synthase-like enzyme
VRKLVALVFLTASTLLPAEGQAVPPTVEVAFSPSGGAEALVVKTIESAKASIRVAAYSFTSKPIATALLDAHKRGIDVRVVVDKSNATARYTAAAFLANQGVPVRVDYRYAIMHDKFVVVDGDTVETGSFNFTSAAEKKNAENVIVLHDPAVAKRYAGEWERLWKESEELKPRY